MSQDPYTQSPYDSPYDSPNNSPYDMPPPVDNTYGVPVTAQENHAPFIDPYQPSDRQPAYLPPMVEGESVETGGASIAGSYDRDIFPDSPNSTKIVAAVMAIVALIVLAGGAPAAFFGLGLLGVTYAVSKSSFVVAWARTGLNLLFGYIAIALVAYLLFSVLGFVAGGHLKQTVSMLLKYVAAIVFAGSAITGFMGRYIRIPSPINLAK